MSKSLTVVILIALLLPVTFAEDKDYTPLIKKAVAKITLNQPGTKPFHLKAVIAPSLERDRNSGRTGEVEIWWESPSIWKREVRDPEFHQIDIANGQQEWQKNEGDYFPEWLRETAVELIEPIPYLDETLKLANEADVKSIAGMIHFSWSVESSNGQTRMGMGGALAIMQNTGMLFYAGGFGWGGLMRDYQNFHGRMVARSVAHGTPEVTAKITTLEDLGQTPANFFGPASFGTDALLHTIRVDELTARKNLIHEEKIDWPPVKEGPLEGALTTQICIDRMGKVREIETIVSNNQGLNDVARRAIAAMEFRPFLENGVPVQIITRITMGFRTVRPTSNIN